MGGAAAAGRYRAPGSPLTTLTGAWRGLRWWVGSVLGDTAYARYVEHLSRSHPDATVPTEREFWRQRYAEQDANPGARCC